MRYVLQADERPDGRLFDAAAGCELFTQRLARLRAGERREATEPAGDEVLYVLRGSATLTAGGTSHDLRAGSAAFVARGEPTVLEAAEDAELVSVLVHDPAPAGASAAVVDLGKAGLGEATAGRQFLLGASPEVGCATVTQFVGLVPPGRAPSHYHLYDEVIYVLRGDGVLHIGDESAPLRPGSCVHLPRTLVHCLENTGSDDLHLLGVFRPAGSPAEAYYPDGTPAAVPTEE